MPVLPRIDDPLEAPPCPQCHSPAVHFGEQVGRLQWYRCLNRACKFKFTDGLDRDYEDELGYADDVAAAARFHEDKTPW